MSYDLSNRLVIAIASSALFDLAEADATFRTQGTDAYRAYQREHQHDVLKPGVAFHFVKRLLSLNMPGEEARVEVILLSRNDPDTGLRVMHSIREHGLAISRAMFLAGRSPYPYIPAFNVSLFLSANEQDVRGAIDEGQVLGSAVDDDSDDRELRVAFDFDGVIADDEAEAVFANSGNNLDTFHAAEQERAAIPHAPGPLKVLLEKIAWLQQDDRQRQSAGQDARIRVAIVTARGAPAHERLVTTLRAWGIVVDETFFLGGIDKRQVLEVFRPHIFFDDQMRHLESASDIVASVHIPFGVRNN